MRNDDVSGARASAGDHSSEYDRVGSPKDEFILALREFWADCGMPHYHALTRVWPRLGEHYRLPGERNKLHPLSVTAISEILAGKRRGQPRPEWVASFVLACQHQAAGAEPGRRDQGLAILRYWTAIHAAHTPAADGPPAAWQLTAAQRAFLAGHGPHSQILITRAGNGHPHARYRAALLLAASPIRIDQAAELLTELASTGYPPALDLLAILARSKRTPADPDPAGQPASPAAREIGKLAYRLACEARARGSRDEATAFCRAAARCGIIEAAIDLAHTLLTSTHPDAAQWLKDATTDPPAGRHHASQA